MKNKSKNIVLACTSLMCLMACLSSKNEYEPVVDQEQREEVAVLEEVKYE